MKILFLVVLAYLIMPIIGLFTLYFTDTSIVAGDVDLLLISSNILFAIIIIVFFALFFISNKVTISFTKQNNDFRSLKRISVIISIVCILMFFMTGYDFLIKGAYRGEIRMSFGIFGFVYKWFVAYLLPVLLALATIIKVTNNFRTSLYKYIYFLGFLSALFTGYKFLVIFVFIPSLIILFYKKNVIKFSLIAAPIVLLILTLTTKLVMGYKTYAESFDFMMHRMTVMAAFGTVGVYNEFPDGVSWSESQYLIYSMFGNNIASLLFGIDFNSMQALETNLSRKMTFLVYPAWDQVLSGNVNVTVTNFGEALYIFGYNFWIYALICGFVSYYLFRRINYHAKNNNRIMFLMFLTYYVAVVLSWFNSSSIFILFSFPVLLYMSLTFITIFLILRSRFGNLKI